LVISNCNNPSEFYAEMIQKGSSGAFFTCMFSSSKIVGEANTA